jgi:uncharacterized membrane protein YbhN (UPF0104 family)
MRVRIDSSNPLGSIIIAIIVVAAACGFVYYILSALTEEILLPVMRVPHEQRDGHVLNKIVLAITGLVAAAGVVMVLLPAFGVDTGFFNLLNILG